VARTGLSYGAWAMLTVVCVILYGGALYYTAIGYGFDLVKWFRRFQLGFVVTTWQRGPEGRVIVLAGFIGLLLVIEAILVGFGGGPSGPGPEPRGEWAVVGDVTVVTGLRTTEGSTDEATPVELDRLDLLSANLTLTWYDNEMDEPGPGITPLSPRNQPDTFRLIVTLPDGTEYSGEDTSDPGGQRIGEVTVRVPQPAEGNITYWIVEVECVQAGDVVGTLGRVWATDDGNDWTLRIEYNHRVWVPAG
jgi:hypothetical protein